MSTHKDLELNRGIVCSDGHGQGCVLWPTGVHLRSDMENEGLTGLADLGLYDVPKGISVWEGCTFGALVGNVKKTAITTCLESFAY